MQYPTVRHVTETRKTPRASRRRRRLILISSLVTTFVLIFGWIGVLVGLQMLSGGHSSLRDETQGVLEGIRDGELAKVYGEASPLFRKRIDLDAFVDLAGDINESLGGFREIQTSKTVEMIDGPGGQSGRVHTTLAFEHGKTAGRFSYHLVDDRWRLLGLSIDMPQAPAEAGAEAGAGVQAAGQDAAIERLEAPSEVLARFRDILMLGRDGQGGRIYDEAAPPFQEAIDRETFLALLAQRERALGRYVDIADIVSAEQIWERNRAKVVARVQFARATTEVTMGFARIDGTWQMTYYKALIPRPAVPDGTP